MRRLLVALGLLGAVPLQATSQSPLPLQIGQVVRVTMRAGPRYVAVLDSLFPDTVVIHSKRPPGAVQLRFGLPAIQTLEVERGHTPRLHTAAKRGGIGLAAGASLGALLTVVWSSQAPECDQPGKCPSAGEGAVVGGATGLIIGLLSGLSGPAELWDNVPLPGRTALALAAAGRGRFGVSVTRR